VLLGCSGDGHPPAAMGRDAAAPVSGPAIEAPAGLWVRTIEGVSQEGVNAISARDDGSFVVLGSYEGPGTFNTALVAWPDGSVAIGGTLEGTLENVTTFNPGLADETVLRGGNIGFVVKLDAAGDVLWARALEQTTGMNGVSSLATFDDDSVVVTGSFDRVLALGDTVLAAIGSDFPGRTQFPDSFVARLDGAGEVTWARRQGGEVWDGGSEVIALDDGAALVVGSYTNSVVFGEGGRAQTTLETEVNESSVFLAVFEPDGSLRWCGRASRDRSLCCPMAASRSQARSWARRRCSRARRPRRRSPPREAGTCTWSASGPRERRSSQNGSCEGVVSSRNVWMSEESLMHS
jgi:hypothetical protein